MKDCIQQIGIGLHLIRRNESTHVIVSTKILIKGRSAAYIQQRGCWRAETKCTQRILSSWTLKVPMKTWQIKRFAKRAGKFLSYSAYPFIACSRNRYIARQWLNQSGSSEREVMLLFMN
jgi:hypothetical protein